MPIAFNLIPANLRTPGSFTEFDASRAVTGLSALPNRVLLIGSQKSGTATALEINQITSADQGIAFYGISQLARKVTKFKAASKFTDVSAIGALDDGGGVAAEKTVTFGGTATSAGTLPFLHHGEPVNVAVASGDAAAAVAAAYDAAIVAAKTNKMLLHTPATVTVVTTLTCDHAAAFGEDLDVRLDYFKVGGLPAGITVAIADTTTGTTNPDASTVIAVIPESEWFTQWVSGWNDAANVTLFETELTERWGPLIQQDAILYTGVVGTFGELSAIGAARNSQFSTYMGGGASPTPDFEWATVTAAVVSNESDPARPYQRLALPGILPPAKEVLFSQSERNLLLQTGISTFTADSSGKVSIERLITTYQENASSQDDTTFLNVNTGNTLFALRYTLNARFLTKYPRHKLVDVGTIVNNGQKAVDVNTIRSEVLAIHALWVANVWVEDNGTFAEELIVERDATDRDRVNVLLGPDLANQLRITAFQIQFIV